VFYPLFKFVHEAYSCGLSSNPSTCTAAPKAVQVLFTALDPSQGISTSAEKTSSCMRDSPSPIEESAATVLARIQEEIQQGKDPRPYTFWVESLTECAAVTRSYACNDMFHEFMQGCAGDETLEVIKARCPITDFREGTDSIVHVFRSERVSTRVERRGACSQESFPECARSSVSKVGERYLSAGSVNCGSAINVSPLAEQIGPLLDSTCVDVPQRLKERYRGAHGLPATAPIAVLTSTEPSIFSATPPTDACTPRQPVEEGDTRRVLCARGASRRAAMQCCERHAGRCVLEELPGTAPNPTEEDVDYILDAASRRIIESVQTMYPPAMAPSACEDGSRNCLHVETSLAGDASTAVAAARVSVPLTLFSWLGSWGTAVVQYNEARRLERSLAGAPPL
jgi:hypothetical protein